MTMKTHEPTSIPKKINVWIVDDDPRYSKTVSEALNATRSVRCDRCFSCCELLLSALKTEVDKPSVILLDIRMPGMDGLEAIPRIKQISAESKVVMLTAFDNDTYVYKALTEGTSGFLLKDTSAGRMVDAIQTVASGGAVMDDKALTKLFRILASISGSNDKYDLSQKQIEILRMTTEGLTVSQIADRMSLSFNTIHSHLKNIHSKLHVQRRGELVAKAIKDHLV